MQTPEIEDQCGRDAEIDEIGKAVEFGAKARGSLQETRQTAVNSVQNGCEYDGGEREHIAVLERHPDCGQSGAHGEQSDDVRRQRTHWNAPEPPAPWIQPW